MTEDPKDKDQDRATRTEEKSEDDIEYVRDAEEGEKKKEEPKVEPAGLASSPSEPKKHKKGESHEARSLKEKLRKKEAEIKFLQSEVDALKDQYLRKMAESENLRKRLEKEKNEYYQFALSEFLAELLGVLDNFERALESAEGEGDGKTFRSGVEMIWRLYLNLLLKKGVVPIDTEKKKFDPNLHHAVVSEESADVEEPEIMETFQKGYLLNNRLLRPALVKVVLPKKG